MRVKKMLTIVVTISIPITFLLAKPILYLSSPSLGQYGIEQLWKVAIVNSDSQTYKVWLEGKIEREKGGEVFWAQSDTFMLKPGTITVRYKDMRVLHSRVAPGYSRINEPNEALSEGIYRFTIWLMPFGVKDTVHIFVQPPGPPRLLSPKDGDTIIIPQPIFSWARSQPSLTEQLKYEIKIVEIFSGQSILQAIQTNPVWFQRRNIKTTNLSYPNKAKAFSIGKKYAWQVTAVSSGKVVGASEVRSFGYDRIHSDTTKGGNGGRCQLPIWVFPNGKAVDFRTSTPSILNLPFVGSNWDNLPKNGWCGQCSNLLFYTQDYSLFGSPGYDYSFLPIGYACHELAVCPVPNQRGRYYLFYYDDKPPSIPEYNPELCYSVLDLNANNGLGELIISDQQVVPSVFLDGRGRGIAISRPINSNDDRYLYFGSTDGYIRRLTIGSTINYTHGYDIPVVESYVMGLGIGYANSQLELSHDGRHLAGTIYTSSSFYPDLVYVMGLTTDGFYDGTHESFSISQVGQHFKCMGVTFAPPVTGKPDRLFFSMEHPDPSNTTNNGIYWVDLGVNGTPQLIPGTKDYCKSQLELAYPGNHYIYAAKANGIIGIDITQDPPVLDQSTLISGISPALNYNAEQYFLPDQIDGEKYDYGTGISPDLGMKDGMDDDGTEPNTAPISTTYPWISPDIWVDQLNPLDPLNASHRDIIGTTPLHSYPIYADEHVSDAVTENGELDVYVMVRNLGCGSTIAGNAQNPYPKLRLYWAKASPSLVWPQSFSGNDGGEVVLPGDGLIPELAPGECWVIRVENWTMPANCNHFCFLARIEEAQNYPYGMTYPEQDQNQLWNVGYNTLMNNNIAWHNVTVEGKGGGKYVFIVRQTSRDSMGITLRFNTLMRNGSPWSDSTLMIDLGELYQLWKSTQLGDGIRPVGGNRVRLTKPMSWLRINKVPARVDFNVQADFPDRGPDMLHITQWTGNLVTRENLVGGVTVMRYDETAQRKRNLQLQELEERRKLFNSRADKKKSSR
jgi:hypothetical protein